MNAKTETAKRSIRRHVLMVGAAGCLVVGGFGGWVTNAELSGAVVASGALVVDSNVLVATDLAAASRHVSDLAARRQS